MGNIIAPPPAVQVAPALVLEEDSDGPALLRSHLIRCKAGDPLLNRIMAHLGPPEFVCQMLKGGADGAGGTARDGFSALHTASACGWTLLVEELLKAGVLDVDAPSREMYTPLMLAAMAGHTYTVELLLRHGAQLGRRSRRGATAIVFAAQSPGNLDALRMLLQHPSCTPQLVRQLGYRQRSALVQSVLSHGSPAVVRALLGAGANPSEACAAMGSVSVLHTCAHLARVDAMRELIAAGAHVNARMEDGMSVLHEVFAQPPSRQRPEGAKRDMFRMLVAAGADVNNRTPERSYTVLHFALCSCREEATANMLLDSGVDLSIALNEPVGLGESAERLTLLHLACMRGWSRLAERLVQAGADLSARSKDGMQPLHTAVLNLHVGTVEALLRLGADPLATCPDCYPSLAAWKMRRGMQALQAMMQAEDGVDVFPALAGLLNTDAAAQDGARLTAVDLAVCVARHIPTVEAFVERGVRPSPEALALAEHAVPIMRAVVERPLLTPGLAARLPARFRAAAREALLCLSRPAVTRDGRRVALTPDAIASVLQQAAFPVSRWADPAWLAAQRVRDPHARTPPAAGQHAQQGGAAPGPAGGAVVHVLGPGEQAPPFVQAMLNQMQQHFEPGAQPQFVVVHQHQGAPPLPGMPGIPGVMGQHGGLGAAAAAAAAGGAAAGAGPAGQAQQGAPGQQFHVMQFQIPLGPGGLPAGPALPPGPPGLPGFMQDFMQGMLAGIADAAAGGGPLPFPPGGLPFGGFPFMFDEDDEWDSDDDEELDDDWPGPNWLLGAPEANAAPPPAQPPAPPAPAGAAAATAEGPDLAGSRAGPSTQVPAGFGLWPMDTQETATAATQTQAAPTAPAGQQGAGDVAGPSGSGAGGSGKRPASGLAAPSGSSGGYNLRDRSKRQRRQ